MPWQYCFLENDNWCLCSSIDFFKIFPRLEKFDTLLRRSIYEGMNQIENSYYIGKKLHRLDGPAYYWSGVGYTTVIKWFIYGIELIMFADFIIWLDLFFNISKIFQNT